MNIEWAKQANDPGRQGLIFGHPKGLYLVSITELWERFSYYGMLGLLVFFLTSSAQAGGFSWPNTTALKLYGIYTGLVFSAPAFGGWLASRFYGERRCILWGGITVAAGHLLLGGPVYFPWLIDLFSPQATLPYLTDPDINFQHFFTARAFLGQLFPEISVSFLSILTISYYLKLWSFLVGLGLIIVGTGLIKPTVSSIIDRLYNKRDPRRQGAFTIFMVCIYVGSFSSNFIAGTLGEKVGWHYGFAAAAIGMLSGIALYIWKQDDYLGSIGKYKSVQDSQRKTTSMSRREKDRIKLLLTMAAFTIVYAVAFYQKGGLLNLYTRDHIDLTVLGFEIPATWLLTISTGIFIFLSPLFALLWRRLSRQGIKINCVHKLSIALFLMALGYVFLVIADFDPRLSWIVLTYICFGIGDIMIWPPQIAAAASLSPNRYTSFTIGAWYVTIGAGTWITGYVGALSYHYSYLTIFIGIGICCAACGAIVYCFRNRLMSLAHGEEL